MRIKVLASGSKGNCTFIQCGSLKFLVDIGITCLQVKNALSEINIQIEEIDAIFITHSHKDHTKGLATLLKSSSFDSCISKTKFWNSSIEISSDGLIPLRIRALAAS